jgi:hypothetical protein
MKYIITEQQQENIINDYLEKYIESGCVTIKRTSKYIIVDVQSPTYFEEFGFDKSEPSKIKNLLKKNSFQYSFGEYIKKI